MHHHCPESFLCWLSQTSPMEYIVGLTIAFAVVYFIVVVGLRD